MGSISTLISKLIKYIFGLETGVRGRIAGWIVAGDSTLSLPPGALRGNRDNCSGERRARIPRRGATVQWSRKTATSTVGKVARTQR